MYVFRDGRRTVSGSELICSLIETLGCWRDASECWAEDCVLAALVSAGELECALLDGPVGATPDPDACSIASGITEDLACSFLTGQLDSVFSILHKVRQLRLPASYEVSVQEGFAYYALHPRKAAMLLDTLPQTPQMAVVGIRSIGVTLSAVACSALRLRGVQCERFTVRPTGHPYNRTLEVTPELYLWVQRFCNSEFMIVDEGPGISGSSFLAVAEALVQCGAKCEQIHMVGSRAVEPSTLRATNASERWASYQYHLMQNAPLLPARTGESLSGGSWRRRFGCAESMTPALWAPLEPAKFLASDEQSIFKFEGFGDYGKAVGIRAKLLAACGFAPRYLGNRCGFGEYELVPGRALELRDRSPELLDRMADYLALRCAAFHVDTSQTPELEKMLRWNWQSEFGEELSSLESQLQTDRVIVCDGRMMPHKWLCTDRGELLKLDAGSHGDNHFFPGPCDVAWDVAGVIAEWELQGELCDHFVREYEQRSGDSITKRLAPYLLAYVTFSLGWSKMAALAMQGEYDEALLQRDYQKYRALAMRLRPTQTPAEITQLKSTRQTIHDANDKSEGVNPPLGMA